MLRLLSTKRWLTWLLVATLWATICLVAGRWQWNRWQEKSTIQERIDTNYDARPVPFGDVLEDGRAPAKDDEWKQVRGTGTYLGDVRMVRNRPGPGGDFGYETVDVFAVDGIKVLVDRGWVTNGSSAAKPSSVPASPRGQVTVTGWVRPSEKSLGRPPVEGQLSSISTADAEKATGEQLVDGYVRMRTESMPDGTTPPRPQALERPSQGMAAGINLSYAIQWWLGIVAGYAFVLMRARSEYLDGLETADPASAGEVQAHDGATAARPRREKKRKQRIWDEEDE